MIRSLSGELWRMPSWLARSGVCAPGAGVICVGLHIGFLSDGILPQQNQTAKILSDKKQYVALHQIMPASFF